MKHRHLAAALLLGTTCSSALASGRPDPSFGDGGLVIVHADYAQPFGEEYASDLLIDKVGRYVTVGQAKAASEDNLVVGLITRHLPNGQADLSFNGTGNAHLETLTHGFKLRAVREQTDGHLLVGGQLVDRETADSTATVICRLDSLGAPDPEFGFGGCRILGTVGDRPGIDDGFADMALQPDGRILVLGRPKAADPDDPRSYALVRLLPNGDDDMSFGDPTDCPAPAPRCGIALSSPFLGDRMLPRALALDSDARIVVAGEFHWSNLDHVLVHRFTAAGDYELGMQSLDFSELMGGESVHSVTAIHVSPDASVLVSGHVFFDGKGKYRIAVGKLDADGQRDAAFGSDGRAIYAFDAQQTYSTMGASLLQSDGKLLVSGRSYPDRKCHVLRIDGESGTLDTAFGNDGVATLDAVNMLSDDCYADAIVADATRVLVAGTTFPLDSADINPFLFRLDRDDLFRDGFDN